MDERWAFPIPMTMQRQAGSPPKPLSIKSPPVAPSSPVAPSATPSRNAAAKAANTAGGDADSELRFDY